MQKRAPYPGWPQSHPLHATRRRRFLFGSTRIEFVPWGNSDRPGGSVTMVSLISVEIVGPWKAGLTKLLYVLLRYPYRMIVEVSRDKVTCGHCGEAEHYGKSDVHARAKDRTATQQIERLQTE